MIYYYQNYLLSLRDFIIEESDPKDLERLRREYKDIQEIILDLKIKSFDYDYFKKFNITL